MHFHQHTNHALSPAPLPGSAKPEPFGGLLARLLDCQADVALQQGYRIRAERLSNRAAELRDVAR